MLNVDGLTDGRTNGRKPVRLCLPAKAGATKRSRQKKRWEDNIKEWTGMDFASSTRAAENRTRWKGNVTNSYVVPRRLSKVIR